MTEGSPVDGRGLGVRGYKVSRCGTVAKLPVAPIASLDPASFLAAAWENEKNITINVTILILRRQSSHLNISGGDAGNDLWVFLYRHHVSGLQQL